jgi:hypothetical protein
LLVTHDDLELDVRSSLRYSKSKENEHG